MVGPSWNSSTWRSRATSFASELSGNCGARTWKPSAWSRSMTPLQQDPSAQAPWTRTMFGRPFTSILPFSVASRPFADRSNDLRQVWSFDPRCASHESVIRNAVAGPAWLRVHTGGRYARWAMSTVRGGKLYGREAELALIQRE